MDVLERINSTSWEADYWHRTNPELLTQLLHQAVPVLEYTGWRLVETRPGFARSVLPLNARSGNQHGVHQAMLLALAADYTGGVALGSLIHGVPIVGVHPQSDRNGAALWASTVDMKFQAPSAADLIVEAAVPPDRWDRVRRRYAQGQAVLETLDISFRTENEVVATGAVGYFLRQAGALAPATTDARVNPLFANRSKASARMIAGVRAAETARGRSLVRDEYAGAMAGAQGRLLADHFTRVLPQLGVMVAARTKDIDDLYVRLVRGGFEQVVLVGAGLDARPFRLASADPTLKVFELDLPHMLDERGRVLSRFPSLPAVGRTPVPIDLRLQEIDHVLVEQSEYDPTRPALLVVEGITMYQNESVNERLFRGLRQAMQHPASTLWVDTVRRAVIDRRTGLASGDAFVDGMERLGEPFVFGPPDPSGFFERFALSVQRRATPNDYAEPDPVFDFYDFWQLGPA